jgi:hypothetical protein
MRRLTEAALDSEVSFRETRKHMLWKWTRREQWSPWETIFVTAVDFVDSEDESESGPNPEAVGV